MLHTIAILVEDKVGALNRVASLLRRRMLNVESLTVAPTARPGLSRITVTIETDPVGAGRVVATLAKLVNVVETTDLTGADLLVRDLALVKVSCTDAGRADLERLVGDAGGRVVDRGAATATIEMTGEPAAVDALLHRLESLGIVDVARSGCVAMTRGDD